MKKEGILAGIISILLLFTLAVVSCDLFTGNNNDDDDDDDKTVDVTGTYTGTIQGYSATLTVSSAAWNLAVPGAGIYESGTYTLSGSTATLKVGTTTVGTSSLSGSTLTVTLNSSSSYPGTYTLTKGSSSGTGDGSNVTGTYTGMVQGYSATLTVLSGAWTLVVPTAGIYESGTYILSGSTATLKVGTTTVGTSSLSGSTLTVALNSNSSYPGTYTLTKGSSSGTGDGSNVTGTYMGTVQGYSATLIVSSGAWTLVVPDAGIYESGTYTLSGNTATLKVGTTTVGTSSLSGSTLTVALNSSSSYPGTYILTKQSA
jgi:hypothetical protein